MASNFFLVEFIFISLQPTSQYLTITFFHNFLKHLHNYSSQNSKLFKKIELSVRACKLVGKFIYNCANFPWPLYEKTK